MKELCGVSETFLYSKKSLPKMLKHISFDDELGLGCDNDLFILLQ